MSLPLQTLTFYRLPDVSVATASIVGTLDALFTALTQTTDFVAQSLPSSHLWSWTKYQNAGTTEAIYCSGIPSGSPMTQTPRPIFAGRVTIGTPSMLYDTATASRLMVGMNLRGGAWNAWDATQPYTSGVFSGYMQCAATAANAVGTLIRVYVSQESIFLQLNQTTTSQYWSFVGAILEPFTNDVTQDADSDNRLYGAGVGGGGAITSFSLSTAASNQDPFTHTVTNGQGHHAIFQPGTTTNGSGGQYTASGLTVYRVAASTDVYTTHSSAIVNFPLYCTRLSSGKALGRYREMYALGQQQGGTTYIVSGVNKVHVIATNNASSSATGISLKAA